MGYEPLGPGDFLSPDELDDDRCDECEQYNYNCADWCLCWICASYYCAECEEHMRDDFYEKTGNVDDDGAVFCDECWNKKGNNK